MKLLSLTPLLSGCIFEDVTDDRAIVGACAFIFVCLVLYSARVLAEHYSIEPEDEQDITDKFRRIS